MQNLDFQVSLYINAKKQQHQILAALKTYFCQKRPRIGLISAHI